MFSFRAVFLWFDVGDCTLFGISPLAESTYLVLVVRLSSNPAWFTTVVEHMAESLCFSGLATSGLNNVHILSMDDF